MREKKSIKLACCVYKPAEERRSERECERNWRENIDTLVQTPGFGSILTAELGGGWNAASIDFMP